MDYEKKYNHALEVVRELQKDWASTQNRAAREIELAFPELRESEDEWIRRRMVEHFKSKTKETWCNIPVKDILKYLEKQKEQKPVEWSEEDDATIKSAVHWLEKYLSTIRAKDVSSATQDGILTVKTTITNLKSLPSSWKPSEEQMEVLLNAEGLVRANNYNENAKILASLYEQLKKL